MKIAIIGSGISGLACAYYLRNIAEVTLFEGNDYLGGHTATKSIEFDGHSYSIDTGFIVYNNRTYPRFIELLSELDIKGQATEMSFSVRNDNTQLEYNGHNLHTLFAQKSNLLNPRFYRFISEILRFNKLAKNTLNQSDALNSLGDFLQHHHFSDYFSENYILPMGAAIWSTSVRNMLDFPLQFFLQFFLNHGLLDVNNRPQWYVVPGGSHSYIKAMKPHLKARIFLNTPVVSVQRLYQKAMVTTQNGQHLFDQVIFACHSDQARKLLSDISIEEEQLLSALPYQSNLVTLHTDSSVLPKRKAAWASWNFRIPKEDNANGLPKITYNMNILQGIQSKHTFCVSLNDDEAINPNKIIAQYQYAHPQYTASSVKAQKHRRNINGKNNTWFCGAYWYNGFHEDGLRSAQDVVAVIKAQAETDIALAGSSHE